MEAEARGEKRKAELVLQGGGGVICVPGAPSRRGRPRDRIRSDKAQDLIQSLSDPIRTRDLDAMSDRQNPDNG